jgi:hypothetical protein
MVLSLVVGFVCDSRELVLATYAWTRVVSTREKHVIATFLFCKSSRPFCTFPRTRSTMREPARLHHNMDAATT